MGANFDLSFGGRSIFFLRLSWWWWWGLLFWEVTPYDLVANYQRYFHPEDEGIRFLQNDGNQLTGHRTFVENIYYVSE